MSSLDLDLLRKKIEEAKHLPVFLPEKKKTGPKPRSAQDAYDYVMENTVRLDNGCLNYTVGRPIAYGYRYICVEAKAVYVHRLVFFITNGFWPEVTRHTCHLTTCVEPTHLLDGTPNDNVQDTIRAGRNNIGARNARTVLSPAQVYEIRDSSLSYAELSRMYGISRGGIKHIKDRVTWRHLPEICETRSKNTLIEANLEDFQ